MEKELLDRYRIRDYYMIPTEIVDNVFYEFEIQLKKQQEINQKAIEYIKSKENGKCIHNGIEKGAYTFVLDFDKAREFIWELLEILEDKEETDTNVGEV